MLICLVPQLLRHLWSASRYSRRNHSSKFSYIYVFDFEVGQSAALLNEHSINVSVHYNHWVTPCRFVYFFSLLSIYRRRILILWLEAVISDESFKPFSLLGAEEPRTLFLETVNAGALNPARYSYSKPLIGIFIFFTILISFRSTEICFEETEFSWRCDSTVGSWWQRLHANASTLDLLCRMHGHIWLQNLSNQSFV